MQTVILAGGFGYRIIEETILKPKALVEVGGIPILCHVLKNYSHYGFNDFIICLGYKGFSIKDYFLNYYYHNYDFTMDFNNDEFVMRYKKEPWKITFVDTGEYTETGGRLKYIQDIINGERFMMTYCDGLTDVNINEIVNTHEKYGKYATLLAVNAPIKFGSVSLGSSNIVESFQEKIKDGSYINGGFFVLEPEVFNYIKNDKSSWEYDCLPKIVADKQLVAHTYDGFWKCMDSIKDKDELEKLWKEGNPPWKVWEY